MDKIIKKIESSDINNIDSVQYENYVKEENYLILQTLDNSEVNSGLNSACRNGCINIAKCMIEKGANNISECLETAKNNNHLDIVKYLERLINN